MICPVAVDAAQGIYATVFKQVNRIKAAYTATARGEQKIPLQWRAGVETFFIRGLSRTPPGHGMRKAESPGVLLEECPEIRLNCRFSLCPVQR
jgi:hypothetical protein